MFLVTARGDAVFFLFPEKFHIEGLKKGIDAAFRKKGDAGTAHPAIAIALELAGNSATLPDCRQNAVP